MEMLRLVRRYRFGISDIADLRIASLTLSQRVVALRLISSSLLLHPALLVLDIDSGVPILSDAPIIFGGQKGYTVCSSSKLLGFGRCISMINPMYVGASTVLDLDMVTNRAFQLCRFDSHDIIECKTIDEVVDCSIVAYDALNECAYAIKEGALYVLQNTDVVESYNVNGMRFFGELSVIDVQSSFILTDGVYATWISLDGVSSSISSLIYARLYPYPITCFADGDKLHVVTKDLAMSVVKSFVQDLRDVHILKDSVVLVSKDSITIVRNSRTHSIKGVVVEGYVAQLSYRNLAIPTHTPKGFIVISDYFEPLVILRSSRPRYAASNDFIVVAGFEDHTEILGIESGKHVADVFRIGVLKPYRLCIPFKRSVVCVDDTGIDVYRVKLGHVLFSRRLIASLNGSTSRLRAVGVIIKRVEDTPWHGFYMLEVSGENEGVIHVYEDKSRKVIPLSIASIVKVPRNIKTYIVTHENDALYIASYSMNFGNYRVVDFATFKEMNLLERIDNEFHHIVVLRDRKDLQPMLMISNDIGIVPLEIMVKKGLDKNEVKKRLYIMGKELCFLDDDIVIEVLCRDGNVARGVKCVSLCSSPTAVIVKKRIDVDGATVWDQIYIPYLELVDSYTIKYGEDVDVELEHNGIKLVIPRLCIEITRSELRLGESLDIELEIVNRCSIHIPIVVGETLYEIPPRSSIRISKAIKLEDLIENAIPIYIFEPSGTRIHKVGNVLLQAIEIGIRTSYKLASSLGIVNADFMDENGNAFPGIEIRGR